MRRIGLRSVAALLLAVVLLAAVPAAAGSERGPRKEPSLLQAMAAWVVALLPGVGTGATLFPAWSAIGSDIDPSGAPENASDDPTAAPQIGSDIDPLG